MATDASGARGEEAVARRPVVPVGGDPVDPDADPLGDDDHSPGGLLSDAVVADEPGAAEAVLAAVIPVLRGWLHLLCFVASVPAGVVLVAGAGSTSARVAAAVYAVGLSALFGVSAAYHRRRWSVAGHRRMKRLDHATIFVMIAGSYTPLCVVVLGGSLGARILVVAWLGAIVGAVMAAVDIAQKPVLGLASYIGLGWVMVIALPELVERLSTPDLVLVIVGGLIYTVGGIVLGTRWPDPIPAVFGYHELWHLMVAAAAVCHYVAISSAVRAAG